MRLIAVVAAGLLLAAPAVAADSGSRHEVLTKLGKRVKAVLEGRDAREVHLGTLREVRVGEDKKQRTPEPDAGLGLMHDLARVLAGLDLKLSSDAAFELRGTYELVKDGKIDKYVIDVALELRSRKKNEVLIRFPGRFTYLEDVLEVAGLSVAVPPNAGDTTLKREIEKALDDERKAPIDGTKVLADKDSPYAVELVVETPRGYEPVRPVSNKGEAYVTLGRDDVYAVRVTNDSAAEAAVTLSIDGLNVFSFSESAAVKSGGYPRVLVPARSSRLVVGWPITLDKSRKFQITSYPETAAFKLNKPAGIGLVSVCVVPSWVKGKKPKDFRSATGPFGTGLGEPLKTPLKMVEREFGDNPTAIHLRYTAASR